ncbi:putative leader peptide [Sinosporangium siamense]
MGHRGQITPKVDGKPSQWPEFYVSLSGQDVTDGETPCSLMAMNPWTELLTKRRAVDFCRVATALCRAS